VRLATHFSPSDFTRVGGNQLTDWALAEDC